MPIVLGIVKSPTKGIDKFMLIFNLTFQFSSSYVMVMKWSIIIIIINNNNQNQNIFFF